MKKEIESVTIKKDLLNKIICFITEQKHDENFVMTEELKEALIKLENGSVSYVVLNFADENEDSSQSDKRNIISCNELTIYEKARRVTKNDKEIILTPKEFDILYLLAKNRGEVFTKEQIYKAVWQDDYFLDDSNIMAFIRKLRKKIETNPDSPQYILTIWGIGYKFNENI